MSDEELRLLLHTDPAAWARVIESTGKSAPPATSSAPSADKAVVTEKRLMAAFKILGANIAEQVVPLIGRTAAIDRRLAGLESALPDAGKKSEDALLPLSTRLSSCETRVGALSMLATRGQQGATTLPDLENLIQLVNDLAARVAELESRPAGLKYVGIWDAHVQNNPGEFCTHAGSIWFCKRATRDRPGTSTDFVLAVKKGQDGKDAK